MYIHARTSNGMFKRGTASSIHRRQAHDGDEADGEVWIQAENGVN